MSINAGAEDRHKFSSLLDDLGVDQPPWRELQSVKDAQAFAAEVQYPVLVRPSFVLSGAAMKVATSDSELAAFLGDAADVSPDHPVVVSKFIRNAKEIEFDAVCRDGIESASFSRDSWPSHDAGGRFFVDVEWIRTAPGVGPGPDVGRRTPRDPRSDRRHNHELRHLRARRERRRAFRGRHARAAGPEALRPDAKAGPRRGVR